MAKQPEGKLVKSLKKMIEAAGGRSFKINGSDDGFQEVGIPDILACVWGRFVGIEAKQRGASLRPAQRVVLREIYNAGGVAAVVETVEQGLQLLSYLKHRRSSAKGICFDRGNIRAGFYLR